MQITLLAVIEHGICDSARTGALMCKSSRVRLMTPVFGHFRLFSIENAHQKAKNSFLTTGTAYKRSNEMAFIDLSVLCNVLGCR
jgi:hypothetical protein